ncbi:MAG: CvpA family protein [Beijerinckiaceae bacterium]|nr:CvpA family protein [Beijerinckiaceae bacterium]
MPSYLDLGLIGVVFISAVLSMLRGFTREVLAIGSWAAAAVAAYYFHPMVLPYIKPYISKDTFALAAAVGAVFLVTLVIVSIITVRISDAILDSKVGALDRTLGFMFGAARGVLLCVVAFLFFNWLVPEKTQPGWVREAKTRPFLQSTGDQLMAMLPEDPLNTLQQRVNRKLREGEPPPEAETPAAPAPAQPPARRL